MLMASPVITIYRNGDFHFSGKKLVVNKRQIRNFETLLDKITHDTQSQSAIRSIRTPKHGSKISNLETLKHGGVYVAVGIEKFKHIQYVNIPKPSHIYRGQANLKVSKPFTQNRVHASARYQKVAIADTLKNRIVFVYQNGEEKVPPIKLLLDKWVLQTMEQTLQYVTNKVKLRTGAVKSLYTTEGMLIRSTQEIETGHRYVAVGYGKPFIRIIYAETGNLSITPRRSNQSKYSNESTNSSYKSKNATTFENERAWRKIRKKKMKENTDDDDEKTFLEQLTNTIEKEFEDNFSDEKSKIAPKHLEREEDTRYKTGDLSESNTIAANTELKVTDDTQAMSPEVKVSEKKKKVTSNKTKKITKDMKSSEQTEKLKKEKKTNIENNHLEDNFEHNKPTMKTQNQIETPGENASEINNPIPQHAEHPSLKNEMEYLSDNDFAEELKTNIDKSATSSGKSNTTMILDKSDLEGPHAENPSDPNDGETYIEGNDKENNPTSPIQGSSIDDTGNFDTTYNDTNESPQITANQKSLYHAEDTNDYNKHGYEETADLADENVSQTGNSLFNATGNQKENASAVRDNDETTVEQVFDMQIPEEVEEENTDAYVSTKNK